jgi:hypothetical protein
MCSVSNLGVSTSAFTYINNTDFQIDMINWKAQKAGEQGAILELTVMPSVNVENISNEQLYAFAVLMRRINGVYGTPVLLRYMHEMNGNWMVYYGMRPREMIASFQTLSRYVHRLTNLTGRLLLLFHTITNSLTLYMPFGHFSHGLVPKHCLWLPIHWLWL